MAEKKDVAETPAAEVDAPWKVEIAALKAQVAQFKEELRAVENRLHSRIGLLDQKMTSPAGTFATEKLPVVGQTIGDSEVVHVSAGVPGGPGPSVVTRGKD